jgi:molecular chaperone DnaK
MESLQVLFNGLTEKFFVSAGAIGIHFSNSESWMAIFDGKTPQLIPFAPRQFSLPTVIAVDPKGNFLFGQEAKRQSLINPGNCAYDFQKYLGKKIPPALFSDLKKLYSFHLEQDREGNLSWILGNRPYSASDLLRKWLSHLRERAQDFLENEVFHAVLTIPSYLDRRQKQLFRVAGKEAGFQGLSFFEEPLAHAFYYGWQNQYSDPNVFLFSLDNECFQASLIQLRGKHLNLLAHDGDTFWGGQGLEDDLYLQAANLWKKKTGVDLLNQKSSENQIISARLKDALQAGRKNLIEKTRVPIRLPFLGRNETGDALDFEWQIKTHDLDLGLKTLWHHCQAVCEGLRKRAGADFFGEGSTLLLSGSWGGFSLLQMQVAKWFRPGKKVALNYQESSSLALAASIYAIENTWENNVHRPSPWMLSRALALSIGLADSQGHFIRIFDQNTSGPSRKRLAVIPESGQDQRLQMNLFQGELRQARENNLLGTFVISPIPGKMGDRKPLEIDFHWNGAMELRVEALEPESSEGNIQVFHLD